MHEKLHKLREAWLAVIAASTEAAADGLLGTDFRVHAGGIEFPSIRFGKGYYDHTAVFMRTGEDEGETTHPECAVDALLAVMQTPEGGKP